MAVPIEDRRRVTIRLSILQYIITVLFSILAVSFWVLQVVQHAKFEEMAENNHQRTLALRAPRGLVLDRNGKVLVANRHSFSISIDRERTKDLNRTMRMLAAVLGLDEKNVRTIVDRHRREPTYRPIVVVQDATLAQVADATNGLKSGDIVGQSGIEKVYNTLLMGEDGAKRVVVNSVGREIRTLEEEEPTEGKRLQLT